jgi:hypothetical protein
VLHGIGGYRDANTGQALVSQFHLWLTVKALALRLCAVLHVPTNWSTEPEPFLALTLAAAIGATLWLAWRARHHRTTTYGLLFTLIAALPVYHLLLIGPDLEKSRVVYLGSAGFALAIAAAASTLPVQPRALMLLLIAVFQSAAFAHNLKIWNAVGEVHRQACLAVAAGAQKAHVLAVDMPNTMDGVYMLATGLPDCVEILTGTPAGRVRLGALPARPGEQVYRWNGASRTAGLAPGESTESR